jgi:hypothetical protein
LGGLRKVRLKQHFCDQTADANGQDKRTNKEQDACKVNHALARGMIVIV